jgi:hypothetical protein
LPIIWIKLSAERFAGAGVKLHGYRDGKAVVEGVPPNSRVVTSGADLINQIRQQRNPENPFIERPIYAGSCCPDSYAQSEIPWAWLEFFGKLPGLAEWNRTTI